MSKDSDCKKFYLILNMRDDTHGLNVSETLEIPEEISGILMKYFKNDDISFLSEVT